MMAKPNATAIEQILKSVVKPYTVVQSVGCPSDVKSIQWEEMRLALLSTYIKTSEISFTPISLKEFSGC